MTKNPFYQPSPDPEPLQIPRLMPGDTLPKNATLDGAYNPALGAFAERQPALAARYGVMRNGVLLPPEQLTQGLSEAKAPPLSDAGAPAKLSTLSPEKKEEAPSFLKGTEPVEPPPPEPQGPSFSKEPPIPDPLDLVHLREVVMEGALKDPETRRLVESRLKGEFDYSSFLLDQPIQQTVVIVPGKLEITFEVIPYSAELLIKRFIAEEAKGGYVDEYLMDKFHLYGVACAVHSVGGKTLPPLREPSGEVSVASVQARYSWVSKLPFPLIALLSIQYVWFCDRLYQSLRAVDPKAG